MNILICITIVNEADNEIIERIRRIYPRAVIIKVENRGRDIWPFIQIYPAIAKHYRYICKVHSKKSTHAEHGNTWRKELYGSLLASPARVAEIKVLFNEFPEVGIIAPVGYLWPCRHCVGINRTNLLTFAQQFGMNHPANFDYDFPAGSMFWFKPQALSRLQDLNIKQMDFEEEEGQLDGTLAHAIERLFISMALLVQYEAVDTYIFEVIKHFTVGLNKKLSDQENFQISWAIIKMIANRDSQYVALNKVVAKRDQEAIKRDQDVTVSLSWRITRPLRFTESLIAKVVKVCVGLMDGG